MPDKCPYCGTLLTTSLRFCVSCRRSVTDDKIKQAGDGDHAKSFKVSKTDVEWTRQYRSFFFALTGLLTLFLIYYCVMKFIIHSPVPFEQQLKQLVPH